MRFVVVGGGIAGVSCSTRLNQIKKPDDTVVLISGSPHVKTVANWIKVCSRNSTFQIIFPFRLASLQSILKLRPNPQVFLKKFNWSMLLWYRGILRTRYFELFFFQIVILDTYIRQRTSDNLWQVMYSHRSSSSSTTQRIASSCYTVFHIFIVFSSICSSDTDSVKTLVENLRSSKRVAIVGNGGIATEVA